MYSLRIRICLFAGGNYHLCLPVQEQSATGKPFPCSPCLVTVMCLVEILLCLLRNNKPIVIRFVFPCFFLAGDERERVPDPVQGDDCGPKSPPQRERLQEGWLRHGDQVHGGSGMHAPPRRTKTLDGYIYIYFFFLFHHISIQNSQGRLATRGSLVRDPEPWSHRRVGARLPESAPNSHLRLCSPETLNTRRAQPALPSSVHTHKALSTDTDESERKRKQLMFACRNLSIPVCP